MKSIDTSIYEPANLFAFCIASHDPPDRTPEQRADMLHRLGIPGYAWGNRMEGVAHLPKFHAEMDAMQSRGISLVGRYISSNYNADEMRGVLDALRQRGLRPQLWVSPGHKSEGKSDEQRARDEAERLRPTVADAAGAGLKVGLYNHAGWFGDPRNLMVIIELLRERGLDNVGIAHAQHWGHAIIDDFEAILPKLKPHLMAITLNGMTRGTDAAGRQMLPVGAGQEDLRLLGALAASGWRGPVGLVNHSPLPAEPRLQDHLNGLAWVRQRVAGDTSTPAPAFRTI